MKSRQSSAEPVRPLGVGWQQLLLLVILPGIAAGITLTLVPPLAASMVAGAVVAVVVAFFFRRYRVFLLMSLILLVPADQCTRLFGPPRGQFALAISIFFAITLAFDGQLPRFRWRDYDVYLFVGSTLLSVLSSADPAQSRVLIFWATGLVVLGTLTSHLDSQRDSRWQIVIAVLVTGALSSMFAWIEYFGLLPSGLMAYYEPRSMEGAYFRPSGLSGHPLRLGTLTMLATFFGWHALVSGRLSARSRILTIVATLLSFTALVLSGARGAWVGLMVSVLVSFATGMGSSRRVTFRIVCTLCISLALLSVTGLGDFVLERTVGSAIAPNSIEQRLEAARVVSRVWVYSPFLGVGPAGVENTLYSAGVLLPNIENEYLITLLSMGLLGFFALLFLVGRRLYMAWRVTDLDARTLALAPVAGLFANMGTYNFFSWSAEATIIVALLSLGWPDYSARRGPRSEPGDASSDKKDGTHRL